MDVFTLKIIAIITMIIDHINPLIYGDNFSWLRCIGRISFPIFAFLLVEGYFHTKDIKKYLLRLTLFALISQYPFYLYTSLLSKTAYLNVGFTLLLGLLSILIYDKLNKIVDKKVKKVFDRYICKYLLLFIVVIIAIIASIIKCDYQAFGVLLIFIFYIFKDNKLLLNISSMCLIMCYYFPNLFTNIFDSKSLETLLFYIISITLINIYNGKKGYNLKWLFYLIYPLHLLILGIIERIIK